MCVELVCMNACAISLGLMHMSVYGAGVHDCVWYGFGAGACECVWTWCVGVCECVRWEPGVHEAVWYEHGSAVGNSAQEWEQAWLSTAVKTGVPFRLP